MNPSNAPTPDHDQAAEQAFEMVRPVLEAQKETELESTGSHPASVYNMDEVALCQDCNTMKHLNLDGLCGRCSEKSSQVVDKPSDTVDSADSSFPEGNHTDSIPELSDMAWLDEILLAYGRWMAENDDPAITMKFSDAKAAIADRLRADIEGAVVQGASIAAEEINRELGLELTTDGTYYLLRHERLAPQRQDSEGGL